MNAFDKIGAAMIGLLFVVAWIAGLVLANGFWSTVFALFLPFWAFYLVIERALMAMGWTN